MRWIVAALTGVAVFGIAAVLFPHDDQMRGSEQLSETGISGRARVIDGDSVYVGGVEVRLFGVDAPEAMQTCVFGSASWPCGREATQALRTLIDGRVVVCDERDQDVHGRVVAVCRHDGTDVNAWLVENGWAMAYRRYGHDYVEAEAEAKSAKRGMWRGELTAPWDWRQASTRGEQASTRGEEVSAAPAGCNIVGVEHRQLRHEFLSLSPRIRRLLLLFRKASIVAINEDAGVNQRRHAGKGPPCASLDSTLAAVGARRDPVLAVAPLKRQTRQGVPRCRGSGLGPSASLERCESPLRLARRKPRRPVECCKSSATALGTVICSLLVILAMSYRSKDEFLVNWRNAVAVG